MVQNRTISSLILVVGTAFIVLFAGAPPVDAKQPKVSLSAGNLIVEMIEGYEESTTPVTVRFNRSLKGEFRWHPSTANGSDFIAPIEIGYHHFLPSNSRTRNKPTSLESSFKIDSRTLPVVSPESSECSIEGSVSLEYGKKRGASRNKNKASGKYRSWETLDSVSICVRALPRLKLRANAVSTTDIALIWSESNSARIAAYQVVIDGSAVDTLGPLETSYTVVGLSEATDYKVQVIGIDSSGVEVDSSPSSVLRTLSPPVLTEQRIREIAGSNLVDEWIASGLFSQSLIDAVGFSSAFLSSLPDLASSIPDSVGQRLSDLFLSPTGGSATRSYTSSEVSEGIAAYPKIPDSDYDVILSRDDRGDAVELLQRSIGVEPTRVFDEATEDAVLEFQRENGLPETGSIEIQLADSTLKAKLLATAQTSTVSSPGPNPCVACLVAAGGLAVLLIPFVFAICSIPFVGWGVCGAVISASVVLVMWIYRVVDSGEANPEYLACEAVDELVPIVGSPLAEACRYAIPGGE